MSELILNVFNIISTIEDINYVALYKVFFFDKIFWLKPPFSSMLRKMPLKNRFLHITIWR